MQLRRFSNHKPPFSWSRHMMSIWFISYAKYICEKLVDMIKYIGVSVWYVFVKILQKWLQLTVIADNFSSSTVYTTFIWKTFTKMKQTTVFYCILLYFLNFLYKQLSYRNVFTNKFVHAVQLAHGLKTRVYFWFLFENIINTTTTVNMTVET